MQFQVSENRKNPRADGVGVFRAFAKGRENLSVPEGLRNAKIFRFFATAWKTPTPSALGFFRPPETTTELLLFKVFSDILPDFRPPAF